MNQQRPAAQKVLNLQGKDYSTWANTLDTAHDKNQSPLVRFLGIETTVLQLPTADNDYTTIVHARAAWLNADGDRVTFDGIGDANPRNTKSQVAMHAIRFAETRAKGRALRDSVNIGDVLEEEMGDEPAPTRPAQPVRPQATHQAGRGPITHAISPDGKKRYSRADLIAQNDRALAALGAGMPTLEQAAWIRMAIALCQQLAPTFDRSDPATLPVEELAGVLKGFTLVLRAQEAG